MMRFVPAVAAALILCACAARPVEQKPVPVTAALDRADARLAAGDYPGAITSYTEFVTAAPKHPQAARAQATEKALEKLLAAQAAIVRIQQNSEVSRRELTERLAETERLKSEIAKLRGDLERLRTIDLQTRPK